MRRTSFVGLWISVGFGVAVGCSSGGGAAPGGPDASSPDGATPMADGGSGSDGTAAGDGTGPAQATPMPSHGSMVGLSPDDSRLVVANRDVGTATVFAVSYAGALPALTKLAEIPVGGEPSAVAVLPDGDTAFVLSRLDQKLTKITGLTSSPTKAGEVAVGSEPTGMAVTPTGGTVWVANWIDGTLVGIRSDTLAVSATVDLNATLAASAYVGAGATDRPSLAHPRAIAITNNGDAVDDDETIYATEFYAQQKTPLAKDASNADTSRVGLVYKVPLRSMTASIIELPAMADMGFKDHTGGTAGCFPNQLGAINVQGGFGYVLSVCASPKAPIGIFSGPAAASCKAATQAAADATCPGGGAGSCGGLVIGKCSTTTTTACAADGDCPASETCTGLTAGTCKTTCTTDAACGAVGGQCIPTSGTDPSVGGTCAPNPADVRTTTATAVSVIDLAGDRTVATANLHHAFSSYFDSLGLPDDASRRFPLLPQDIGFVPGTTTAYIPAFGADALFRVDFDATNAARAIDGLGDPKAPFMNLDTGGDGMNGQLPSGVAVAHATHTAGSGVRYAFVVSDRTRNVAVVDLAAQEVAGMSAGTPTFATASPQPTDPHEIDVLDGRFLFFTGLGRWSWNGQAWQSCLSCHGDSLSDNVTWYIGRGPRQSPNLDATFIKGPMAKGDQTDYRVNSWEGVQDEIADHEGAIRSLSGGVGAIVKDPSLSFSSRLDVPNETGLNGSSLAVADPANPGMFMTASAIDDWKKIVTWARTVRSPRKPSNLDPAKVTAGQALFMQANCQGCHSGPTWTASTIFYTPDPTGTVNSKLKTTSWSTAVHQANFPASLLPVADDLPTPPAGTTYSGQTMRYSGNKPALYDQLTCALRPVGTFGVAQSEAGIAELRADLVTVAQGGEPDCNGFNIPSLLSVQVGAPYFHAGNALTLEGLFSDTFAAHHQALAPGFLAADDAARADHVASLIEYVLSIDGDTTPIAVPPLGPQGGSFCAGP